MHFALAQWDYSDAKLLLKCDLTLYVYPIVVMGQYIGF